METIRPDLSTRPWRATAERVVAVEPRELFRAFTDQIDRWFAAPGTVLMDPRVDAPYFFETRYDGQRHPHYGRFLRLEPDRLVEMTWLTAAGTRGAETVVTVELTRAERGTRVRVTQAGLPDEDSLAGLEDAWSATLEHLERCLRPGVS